MFASTQGVDGWSLMKGAAFAIADAIINRWSPRPTLVICGPGNNGGDGFVAARLLLDAGWPVRVAVLSDTGKLTGDAKRAFEYWNGKVEPASVDGLENTDLIVDAMFGAGLSRPLDGVAAQLCDAIKSAPATVVAVDVPSGVGGDRANATEPVIKADLTVTFHRLKPAHCLEPGHSLCGDIVLADIGIPDGWRDEIKPVAELNQPSQWPGSPHVPTAGDHKHKRGRLVVLSGGPSSTGAARLAAQAGLRTGAGLVTLLSPKNALQINAMASLEVMVRGFSDVSGFRNGLEALRATAAVIGPGCGVGDEMRERVVAATSLPIPLILDADALTSFETDPTALFSCLRVGDVLTPHTGEFDRLFSGLRDQSTNKIEAVRSAARHAGAVVVLKGADTVIAAPDGRVRVNQHASPTLATAGSGDVLVGMIGAILAQGHDSFDAASCAVWLHGDCGLHIGGGLIAGDLIAAIPDALSRLQRSRQVQATQARLK